MGDLYVTCPALSIMFIVAALSLAGLPPFPGFFAKFALIRAGLEAQHSVVVISALCVSILTLYSMIKIWAEAFWKSTPENSEAVTPLKTLSNKSNYLLYMPLISLVLLMVAMAVWANPLFEISRTAAEQLLNPQLYIEAVKLSTP